MTNGTSLFFSAHHDCRHKFKNWNIRHDIFDHVVCCHIPPRWFNLSTIKPLKEGNFLSFVQAYLPTDFLFSVFTNKCKISILLINVKLVGRTWLFRNPPIIPTRTTRWFWNFSEFFENSMFFFDQKSDWRSWGVSKNFTNMNFTLLHRAATVTFSQPRTPV